MTLTAPKSAGCLDVVLRYGGSKRRMLDGALGELLLKEIIDADRFCDLFTGSAVVAQFVATSTAVPVLAFDLQRFATVLANAVIARDHPIDIDPVMDDWFSAADQWIGTNRGHGQDWAHPGSGALTEADVCDARTLCEAAVHRPGFAYHHYGGHYFSPTQAAHLDGLVAALPQTPAGEFSLGCLLVAAARSSASPGHMAQPFQPKPNQLPWIDAAWQRNLRTETRRVASAWGACHAQVVGRAAQTDAISAATEVAAGDVVFCDPPYADVQYSRLYHVLEGLARGGWAGVAGTGRSPAVDQRARSPFSTKKAPAALIELLRALRRQAPKSVVFTLPGADAGNGLTAGLLTELATGMGWGVTTTVVSAQRSTLGGTATGRGTRVMIDEHILVLH